MKNLFLLGALLIPTIVYSANDLERWNSEVGRTVRQTHSDKLAQTTYSEISSKNVNVSQDMKTVYPQIETNAQVAGSRTRVVAEATLVVDKDKVWKDWSKKIAKVGRVTNAVGGALVVGGLILKAADWVIDEGGKVTKKPDDSGVSNPGSLDPSVQFGYESNATKKIYSNEINACDYLKTVNGGAGIAGASFAYADYNKKYCYYSWKGDVYAWSIYTRVQNPNYDPSAQPPENTVVSEEEKEQILKNLLNDPKYADLAAQMIGNTYSMGPDNSEPDPNVVNDLKNAQKEVLKSDNPKGDGKTRTDPKIDTGTQGQADTTPKPDTGTGTNPDTGTGTNPDPNTGSTTNFELPAFCNYAAKLCDWLDWTQEDKELEEAEKEEPEELDLGTIDKNRFRANGQCPAPIQVNESVRSLGKSVDFDLTIEWTQICNVAEDTSPLVLLISTITGLLILVGGGRSSEP
jgi:hypothetical protein